MTKLLLLLTAATLAACASSPQQNPTQKSPDRAAASVTDSGRSALAMSTDECWGRLLQIQHKRLAQSHADGSYGTGRANMRFNPSGDLSQRYVRYCEQFGFFKDKKPGEVEQSILNEMYAAVPDKNKGA